MPYKNKCRQIAEQLGFKISLERNKVYLVTDDGERTELLVKPTVSIWKSILAELDQWGGGCNLIQPVDISKDI